MTAFFIILTVLIVLFLIYALVLVFPGIKGARKAGFSNLFCDYTHRGLWGDGAPENSLLAFKRAAQNGYGIELDVRLSADGEVFVLHDDDLKRVTGFEGKLSALTAEQISALRFKDSNQGIPRFEDVLREIDGKVPLLIELKGVNLDTSVCVATDRLLKDYKGPYCIESFNPFLVGWFRKNRPQVMRGQLTDNRKKPLSILFAALVANFYNRPDFIAHDYKHYNRLAVWLATKLWGAESIVWTIKDKAEFDDAHQKGFCTIFEGFLPEKRD